MRENDKGEAPKPAPMPEPALKTPAQWAAELDADEALFAAARFAAGWATRDWEPISKAAFEAGMAKAATLEMS
jgi:hypothetical protein